MYAPDSTAKKPTTTNRLSAMFSRQKSTTDRPSLSPSTYPNANGNNSVDSAYASSSNNPSDISTHTSSPESRHANMVSIENNGQISGVDGSRHLQLNQKTGEVLDEDTGEVVTTVTTTTTTTTTVVKKGGGSGVGGKGGGGTEVRVETQPGHPGVQTTSTQQQRVGGGGGQQVGHIAEAPGDGPSARFTQPDHPPTFTSASTARERSPVPAPLQIGRQPQVEPSNTNTNTNQNPALPQHNPNRSSREYTPGREYTSPPSPITPGTGSAGGRHNFSYPARMGTKSTEHLPQQPGPQHMVSQETIGVGGRYSPPGPAPPSQQQQGWGGREGYSFSTGQPQQPPPAKEGYSFSTGPQPKEAHSFSTGVPIQHTQTAPQHQGRSSGGALGNLKAAAIGLHGVGETLRGTLNSEVDNRLSRRNPDKAAAVNAKNRADIERGQAEMARLRERNGLAPTIRRPGQEGGQQDGGALGQSVSAGGLGQGAGEGRVSQHAPQIPPMQNYGNVPSSNSSSNASTTTPAGAAMAGVGGVGAGVQPSKWDAPGTWGSGAVSSNPNSNSRPVEKPLPQVRVGEVHPALRGQEQSTQPQNQAPEPPRYGAPPPAAAVGAQRVNDSASAYPGGPSSGPTAGFGGPGAGTSAGLSNVGGRGKPIPLNEPGVAGNVGGSGVGNVQHLSQTQQGNSHQAGEEERKKGGLGRLFKRKGVGA
ncbi:hypothetical protein LTR56_010060 [Elasticomyces elasticus]|nr:hypothetical protein LTR56_010060 [Elasticomyces elasticus]KAK3664997.1 hypothetical protein LTR22_004049 [Elasticomyces elasticus]KAK4931627.1 hypothetical protein LTR49_002019 [Elasticomyces elasticus]KAK5766786.1 hypothetical protein LTS12_003139 [Elasticomyces elasticus]